MARTYASFVSGIPCTGETKEARGRGFQNRLDRLATLQGQGILHLAEHTDRLRPIASINNISNISAELYLPTLGPVRISVFLKANRSATMMTTGWPYQEAAANAKWLGRLHDL